MSRPSPDYPMLPTIPLSAFSDPKKTKPSHGSKVSEAEGPVMWERWGPVAGPGLRAPLRRAGPSVPGLAPLASSLGAHLCAPPGCSAPSSGGLPS